MMRKLLSLALFATLVSCKKDAPKEALYPEREAERTPVEAGKEIFEGKGNCVACHLPDKKVIGPSIIEIANIYKAKNADMVAFLREEADPIVDPEKYSVMKTNFAITKALKEEDLKALEAFVLSHAK